MERAVSTVKWGRSVEPRPGAGAQGPAHPARDPRRVRGRLLAVPAGLVALGLEPQAGARARARYRRRARLRVREGPPRAPLARAPARQRAPLPPGPRLSRGVRLRLRAAPRGAALAR